MTVTVGGGSYRYDVAEGWGKLPEDYEWGEIGAVAVDNQDRVHVCTRTEHPVLIFDRDGNFLQSWGEGILVDPHGIYFDREDNVFYVDRKPGVVIKFNAGRQKVWETGDRDHPSDTGFTRENRTVLRGAGPFNHPTDIALSASGDFYVSDGYRNARVHKFSADGTLLQSWGEPGDAKDLRNSRKDPGKFHTPHGIWVHGDRVFLLDRENNRIQIFSTDGEFQDMWTELERPTDMYVDREGVVYISELEDHVSIRDLDGNVIGRFGSERSNAPGKFWGPHAIWVDSVGDMYIGEVLEGQRLQKFARRK